MNSFPFFFRGICIHPSIQNIYKLAKTAAPPNNAPTATAPVLMGAAALGLVALEAAASALSEADVMRALAELVSELMALVMDSRSEPVAVESCDSSEATSSLASLRMELMAPVTSEPTDERTEVACDAMELMSTGLERVGAVRVWAWLVGLELTLKRGMRRGRREGAYRGQGGEGGDDDGGTHFGGVGYVCLLVFVQKRVKV